MLRIENSWDCCERREDYFVSFLSFFSFFFFRLFSTDERMDSGDIVEI